MLIDSVGQRFNQGTVGTVRLQSICLAGGYCRLKLLKQFIRTPVCDLSMWYVLLFSC